MTVQRDLATTQQQQFNFIPTSLQEAQDYAKIIANSGICPENFRGRPNDVLIVLQCGAEIGLKPMQSLRTLGCVNGMPFTYGDGGAALIKRHPEFKDCKEWYEGDISKGTLTAYCTAHREGREPLTQQFSIEDAKRAGLWDKKGVWQAYPKRMLMWRARNYAFRDAFPDVLTGILSQDEAYAIAEQRIDTINQTKKLTGKGMTSLEEALGVNDSEIIEAELISEKEIENAPTLSQKLDYLKELIMRFDIKPISISRTFKKFGVENYEELTDDMIEKWINHLTTRKNQDDKS